MRQPLTLQRPESQEDALAAATTGYPPL
jgi:hypothetical protein